MSHPFNCPHCHDQIASNARECTRTGTCCNCGQKFKNEEGYKLYTCAECGQQWEDREEWRDHVNYYNDFKGIAHV
jgi:predicted RNA-binding Zn-ribbon protein involved in translation (DUF1610 family)